MVAKIEGTVFLDGLLEGKLPSSRTMPDAEARLREWIDLASSAGLRFSLEIEGDSFSLLADSSPLAAHGLGSAPSETVAEALSELLKAFGPEERRGIFSTVRSVEYRKGTEVQTVYVAAADGTIDAQQRTVDAETVEPEPPLAREEKVKLALLGLAAALLVFAVSAVFVDYRAVFSNMANALSPVDAEEIEVDASAFGEYFTVEKKEIARGGRELVITLARTAAFPRTLEDAQARASADGGTPPPAGGLASRLALEAVFRGYVNVEAYDEEGGFLSLSVGRVKGLREEETVEIAVPVSRHKRPGRVVVTY